MEAKRTESVKKIREIKSLKRVREALKVSTRFSNRKPLNATWARESFRESWRQKSQ